MTTTAQVLTEILARGVTLVADGDRLRFYPRDAVTGELLQRLRTCKAELLAMLQPQASGNGYTTHATTGGTAVVSPAMPQDVRSHSDAAGPAAAGDGSQGAGPSETDRPAGQAVPGADPLGADGPQDDRGDAAQALQSHGIEADGTAPPRPHGDAGGADGSQDLAAAPQATAGPRTRPAVPVAAEWPAAAADFALLLVVDDLPRPPFKLNDWTVVQDAGQFLRWLQADLRRGPTGPRAVHGAIQTDLRHLQQVILQAADERQQKWNRATIGGRTGEHIGSEQSVDEQDRGQRM